MSKPIYLDYNATTPIDAEVAEAMKPFLDHLFGNPSSMHQYGVQTRQAVELARRQIAQFINCFPDEVVFTSGGTESNNYAIKGAAFQNRHKGNHIITSQIEHPAVSEVCRFLETQGFEVSYLPVDSKGRLDPAQLEREIKAQTILITVMHANNEVGTIQPIEEISLIARQHGIVFHSDAAQSAGKIPVDVKKMGVDLLSLAGHKLYAPKGVGALFVKRGVPLQKLMHGANHEQNLRAGTENVLEIAGLGKAAEVAARDSKSNALHMKAMTDLLYGLLKDSLTDIRLNGHARLRLPNTLSIGFGGVQANLLLDELEGIAASAGAACHADQIDVSPVLTAMQVPEHYAMGTLRFSTGKQTSEAEIREAARLVIQSVTRLQSSSMVEETPEVTDNQPVRLTRYTQGLGCACKIRPQYLEKVLMDMPPVFDKNVLVGTSTADDAAVYRLTEDLALVQTLDFFTPVVDDPWTFGAIAAANALSDIYAMGAKPMFALNIVGFPSNRLPMQVLKDILKGASDKATEAGISILGGHTVEDPEPKFGMVVSGIVHPEKFISNSSARPGDVLILTKPIGTGIIATAVKRNLADEKTARAAINVMIELNASAAALMEHYPVSACTDITGFGLMGHLNEMMTGSDVSCRIDAMNVPLIEGVADLAISGVIPGGTRNNMEHVANVVKWANEIPEYLKLILCDAQTSGGLLIALEAEQADKYLEELERKYNMKASRIGVVSDPGSFRIEVAYNNTEIDQ
ncbi:MAG: selenide, water dikinase SelD [Bacteroidetes bacterium]|nr:MAG: selenide, water dikinase SelD [Bacteroidota bacterium]